jgi:hypothetical protein
LKIWVIPIFLPMIPIMNSSIVILIPREARGRICYWITPVAPTA